MKKCKYRGLKYIFINIVIVYIIGIQGVRAQKSDPLPDGWKNVNIGEPALPSVTIYNKEIDKITLSAGGIDTWNTADECNYVYFETEEDKEVVVRMLDYTGTGWNSKGFIMIRSSLDPGASMCFLEATPHSGSTVFLSGRRNDNTNAEIFGQINGVFPLYPRWIKFVRQGKYITGYHKDDVPGASWVKVVTVKLALKGKAYLGIGACGGGGGTGYVTVSFDHLVVKEIEIPYEVKKPTPDQVIKVEATKKINVTETFGHYIGDYWTINAESTDENIVTASFSEEATPNSETGEEYAKYINIVGINDGVAVIKLTTNIKGFKMRNDFVVEVNGTTNPSTVTDMDPPNPWKFNDLYGAYLGDSEDAISNPYKIHTIPDTVEAEDFDNNGYFDVDTTNDGGAYRTGIGVDIFTDTLNPGNFAVSNLDSVEWLEYTINVETTGIYKLDISMTSKDPHGRFFINLDGKEMVPVTNFIQTTGGMFNWKNKTFTGISLNKGNHLMKFYRDFNTDTSDAAINRFVFTLVERPYENMKSQIQYFGSVGDSVKILTELMNTGGLEDNVAFLYQNIDISNTLQMTALIGSVKNTGKGSFTGLMLRQSFDSTNAVSPFVSFGAGAYEGLKMNFRWDDGVDIGSLDDENVKLPCWIRITKFSEFGSDYLDAFYSYDGIYWNDFLKYPLNIKFLENNVLGGLATCGGSYALKRKELVTVKNLDIKINQPFDPMLHYTDSLKEAMTISPNPVSTSAEISYKIVKPGKVVITVYNSFGNIVDVLVNGYHDIGKYTYTYNAQELSQGGMYLLKLVAVDNYEFLKFIYKP